MTKKHKRKKERDEENYVKKQRGETKEKKKQEKEGRRTKSFEHSTETKTDKNL